ncbi:MAG: amylo-alpha-1,6-glucosidase [Planctomycetota bacterium]
MLTLQRGRSAEVISVPVEGQPLEELLSKEWLLTNERGGYASSTIIGCNTRRYHGLLIGSVNPLANRIMGLANCLEMVILNRDGPLGGDSRNGNCPKVFNLSTFEFSGKFAPEGFKYITCFRRDVGVHFDYRFDRIGLTKSAYLAHDADTVALVYDFTGVDDFVSRQRRKTGASEQAVEFVLRPFAALRDFHALQRSYTPLCSDQRGDGLLIHHDVPGGCELFLSCSSMDFRKDQQWWFNFVYRSDKERGQDFMEDLWSPGFFKCRLDSNVRIVFWARLGCSASQNDSSNGIIVGSSSREWRSDVDIQTVCEDLHKYQRELKCKAKSAKRYIQRATRDTKYEILCLAADQFIARRQINQEYRTTILAGFPWFADWGRDAFISLPGLLLATGRFEEAKSVLTTFARAADEGMIPNRFDDYSATAYFNSIDASLWFVYAAFQYLEASMDSKTFAQKLLPTIRWVVDSFQKGARFGICADTDGLITGGNEDTQLTWMDAKYEGVAFTARYGKAVEVNALWYNNLCYLAQFYADRDADTAKHYKSLSDRVATSFFESFWNDTVGYLNDCILPDGSVDSSLRPNQIFAVSLPFSAVSLEQQKRVVEVVEDNLLTPRGLRTLDVQDSRYRGEYTGPQRERDEAYHQGTVWPYLIGPFVEAYLKVNDFGRKSKKKAADFIQPLMQHLTEDDCIGQVSEIFDGDAPHEPKGCMAQAWSVAELIRAYQLINS